MLPFDYPYIRDEIVIDGTVNEFCAGFVGGGPVFLLARRISHSAPLTPGTRPVVIVCDEYDGTGGMIDASGRGGAGGGGGANGAHLGESGGSGGVGGRGGNGGDVTVYCRRSVNAHVSVAGGYGGRGGDGGNGADGKGEGQTAGWVEHKDLTPWDATDDEYEDIVHDPEIIPGVNGGRGGLGGTGGAGGDGGTIRFTSIEDANVPVLEAQAGAGNSGGWGGYGGMFSVTEEDGTNVAPPGGDGSFGQDGTVSTATVSEADFVAGLWPLLGEYANYWAPFRLAVGDWYYHRHVGSAVVAPGEHPADDDGYSELAATEFVRALELQPDNASALRLQRQIESGANALGLDPALDVLPVFDQYMKAYLGFGALALNFVTSGTGQIVAAMTLDALGTFADLMHQQAVAALDSATDQLGIATTEKGFAADEIAYAQQRVDQASADITAEMARMEQARIDAEGFPFGTVAQVGLAVVSVIAAVPTAGASLVAMVPSVATLASTVLKDAAPIANATLNGSEVDVSDITAAYKKIGKDAPKEIAEGAKSVINFVSVVQKLAAVTTADNAKYIELVRRGVELAHELLLAQRRTSMAGMRVEAVQHQIERAQGAVASAAAFSARAHAEAATLREAGEVTVAAAQAAAASLLGFAFRAQRAVEIYTLKDQGAAVRLDTGLLTPDFSREYDEGRHTDAEHVAAVEASWNSLLRPIALEDAYQSYFDSPPDTDQLRLSFAGDGADVATLRSTGRLPFRIDLDDLPAGRFDAKVVGARVALVGATHPDGLISTQLRHGSHHEQRRADGTVDVQLLAPRTTTRQTILTPLAGGIDADLDAPLTEPTTFRLWGRGLAGDWELTIPADQQPGLDLSQMTTVQVWLAYRFIG